MESNEEKQEVIVQFNRTDAIPDAPRYDLTTVAEIMAVLTPENVDRFLEDWATGIKGMVLTVDLVKQVALDADGTVLTPEMLGINKFTWIDDAPRTTPRTMTYESELEEIEHKNQMVALICDQIINWDGVGVCDQPLQHIKEVYRDATRLPVLEEDEDKVVRELEERTHRNMELISAFCEHVKEESGVVIDESVVLSFFDA